MLFLCMFCRRESYLSDTHVDGNSRIGSVSTNYRVSTIHIAADASGWVKSLQLPTTSRSPACFANERQGEEGAVKMALLIFVVIPATVGCLMLVGLLDLWPGGS